MWWDRGPHTSRFKWRSIVPSRPVISPGRPHVDTRLTPRRSVRDGSSPKFDGRPARPQRTALFPGYGLGGYGYASPNYGYRSPYYGTGGYYSPGYGVGSYGYGGYGLGNYGGYCR